MSNLTYKQAGVDIVGGDSWIDTIKNILKHHRKDSNVVAGVGGFNGLYRLAGDQLIVGCCDGVGTKVELARATGIYTGLGQDLVAMNVNDLVTGGARPLFFLDYIACGSLDEAKMAAVVDSVASACDYCSCALLGGETAEMPGVYDIHGMDLAGFAVGAVKETDVIDGSKVTGGDVIIGLHSSGIHSNGYTLVRKAFAEEISSAKLDQAGPVPGETLGQTLMTPTRLYVPQALAAAATKKVKAMAHITGSGMTENIDRVIPDPFRSEIDFSSWQRPAIFDLIASKGVAEEEMRRVFNLGIGYVLIVSPGDVNEVCTVLEKIGEKPRCIGKVVHK